MNHRITFQKKTVVVDDLGWQEEVIQDFKSVWCAIKTVQGREYFAAASTQNENTYRFVIRHMDGLHPSMKIKYDARLFEIESILNDDEANRTITIIAKEKF
ncbi:phage head closure protein [Peribacillus sp. NPDC097675]|uniref:phage head closure protein n=1 Tax=Peribacillus sp. NPDC097675 TaxID=3390618 RepID=UPI003D0569E0